MNDTQSLPEDDSVLAQLIEQIGQGPALSLCAAFGGTEVYIPRRLTKDHPIAKTIGLDAAEKLARYAGNGQGSGGRLEIPRGVALSRARRNDAIQADLADGLSKQQIALRHKLTTRWVRKICNGDRDDGQGDLF